MHGKGQSGAWWCVPMTWRRVACWGVGIGWGASLRGDPADVGEEVIGDVVRVAEPEEMPHLQQAVARSGTQWQTAGHAMQHTMCNARCRMMWHARWRGEVVATSNARAHAHT